MFVIVAKYAALVIHVYICVYVTHSPWKFSISMNFDTSVSNIITVHTYMPSSSSVMNSNSRVLVKSLPLDVVGQMDTLLLLILFVMGPSPINIQLNDTEFMSTPLTVLAIHWKSWGPPTTAPWIGPDGVICKAGFGTAVMIKWCRITTKRLNHITCNIQYGSSSSYNWWTSVDHYLTLVHSTIISCAQLWDSISSYINSWGDQC